MQFVFNLRERSLLEQRKAGTLVSAARIREAVATIHDVSNFTLGAAVAFAVVGFTWSIKRRTRSRVARYGEAGVERRLRTVWPVVYWTFWVALGVSLMATLSASSKNHIEMTVDDFISYRGSLATSSAARTLMWACWIPLVARATKLQDRREAMG